MYRIKTPVEHLISFNKSFFLLKSIKSYPIFYKNNSENHRDDVINAMPSIVTLKQPKVDIIASETMGIILKRYKKRILKRIGLLYFELILKFSLFYFFKLAKGKVNGIENLKLSNQCIIALNHESYLDWLFIYAYFKYHLKKHVTFLAKEKLFSSFLWGPLMYAAKCVRVPQEYDMKSYRELINKLQQTNSIIAIFPEGTRSCDGEIQESKTGIINIAQMLGKPIIPIGLKGFYQVWSRKRPVPKLINIKRYFLSVNIGKPIFLPYKILVNDKKQSVSVIMKKIKELIL